MHHSKTEQIHTAKALLLIKHKIAVTFFVVLHMDLLPFDPHPLSNAPQHPCNIRTHLGHTEDNRLNLVKLLKL